MQRAEVEGRTACAALVALDGHEITLGEFTEAIEPLTSEALQVLGTALRKPYGEYDEERLQVARMVCFKRATAARILS